MGPATQTVPQWRQVDEGWGREAVDFATLSEPANCREYVALHEQLSVGRSDSLLDIACGAGLALELAAARGAATCAGIDASPRLLEVAGDRVPRADLRVGDMHALPWADGTFTVATSFRGIWGTTPDAVREAYRVLAPGGRFGLTVWGHIKASPGAWALRPFTLATREQVAHQAAMVSLGRPGVGEELLADAGFVGVERVRIPFAWEFADPAAFARALASTGPAWEAIRTVGEEEFLRYAESVAEERVRAGLPLRAEIDVVGYLARKPVRVPADHGFLSEPAVTPEAQAVYDDDVEHLGYVMNNSHLWAHDPESHWALGRLLAQALGTAGLTYRQRSLLVAATASEIGDSYCSLAWGSRLAREAGTSLATSVLRGGEDGLDPGERALAAWARRAAREPTGTTAHDIQTLREAGFDDPQIFGITLFVGLRLAFSTVNNALGALPDRQFRDTAPAPVLDAVRYGRPIAPARDPGPPAG